MRGGCIFLAIALGMTFGGCWGGTQGLYTRVMNLSPLETTCADYVATRPSKAWLKVSTCYGDVLNSAIETGRYDDTIERMWIPMYDVGGEERELAFVLETDDPAHLDRANALVRKIEGTGDDPASMLAALEAIQEASKFDVEGLIAFGWELDDDEHAEVAGLVEGVGDDFAVLRSGDSPSLMGALLYLVMSFVGMGLLTFIFAPGNDE